MNDIKEFLESITISVDRKTEPQIEKLTTLFSEKFYKNYEQNDPNDIFDRIEEPGRNRPLRKPESWRHYKNINPSDWWCPEELQFEEYRLSVFDILGEYKPNEKKIVLYVKNIKKAAESSKAELLKIYQWLGAHPVSHDTFHFPLDNFIVYYALMESLSFREFTLNIISRWPYLFGDLGPAEKHKNELLTFDEAEIFNILWDLTLMHEAGHALHHALTGDSFKNIPDYTKEGLADLNALFCYDDVKHKVIFFSFAYRSYYSWYYFYREAYKKLFNFKKHNIKEICSKAWDNRIGFLKEIWESYKSHGFR